MNQLTVTLIVVIGLLGGFYGGFKYGQNHPPPSTNSTGTAALAGAAGGGAGAGNGGGRGGGGFGGNAISGQVTAVGNGTITVHNSASGQDVQVNVSSARITKTSQGSSGDLTQNTQVSVVGSADSSGTVNATVVSIGGGGGRFGAGGQPSPSPST
jgi:hypothetical protein